MGALPFYFSIGSWADPRLQKMVKVESRWILSCIGTLYPRAAIKQMYFYHTKKQYWRIPLGKLQYDIFVLGFRYVLSVLCASLHHIIQFFNKVFSIFRYCVVCYATYIACWLFYIDCACKLFLTARQLNQPDQQSMAASYQQQNTSLQILLL